MKGLVAARVVESSKDAYLVSVPSREVVWVDTTEIVEHPKGSRAHVPVKS